MTTTKSYLTFAIFISIAFISCKKSNAEIICDGNCCFWKTKFDEHDTWFKYYYFDKNGKWAIYEENDSGKIHKLSNLGCEVWEEKWSLHNDTLLNLGGEEYAIKNIQDSMMVISIDNTLYKLYKIDKCGNTFKNLQEAANNKE